MRLFKMVLNIFGLYQRLGAEPTHAQQEAALAAQRLYQQELAERGAFIQIANLANGGAAGIVGQGGGGAGGYANQAAGQIYRGAAGQIFHVGGDGQVLYGNHPFAAHDSADVERGITWDGGLFLKKGKKQRAQMLSGITFESRDEQGRFHNATGPALVIHDAHKYFFWHGLETPSDVIFWPDSITLDRIESCRNLEVRRVLIERYRNAAQTDRVDGCKLFMMDCAPVVMDHDERFGTLVKKPIPLDVTIAMVIVTNRSPEKDGSFQKFYLRVPPEMLTAREAVAWTFRRTADEYDPIIES